MNADTATQLVLVLLGAALVFALIGWAPYGRTIGPPLALLALGAAAVLASVSEEPTYRSGGDVGNVRDSDCWSARCCLEASSASNAAASAM